MNLLHAPFMHALGWTLIHSLWQGLAIFVAVFFFMKIAPVKESKLRYVTACGALLALCLLIVMTFVFLLPTSPHGSTATIQYNAAEIAVATPPGTSWANTIALIISSNIHLIVAAWIVGVLLSSFRLVAGLVHLSAIRQSAMAEEGVWYQRVAQIAFDMGVRQTIRLAVSARASAPIVIGYLKPIIILPLGMLADLPASQIEAILIHELAHIKRHDFIVNLIQTVIESLLFFNPFVWMLSSIIRREREYCCDDAAVQASGNALLYAKALATLEEVRLTQTTMALALASEKNQLLTRIKRLMEKSVQTNRRGHKLLPVLLIVVGLLSASWLSIHSEGGEEAYDDADTVIRKKDNSARYSRKSITTFDENGEPHEEVTEEFEGDETLKPFVTPVDPAIAPFPSIGAIPDPPLPYDAPAGAHAFPAFPIMPDVNFMLDTLPGFHAQWKAFGEEFEKSFKGQFEDFYKTHEEDLEKMLLDIEKNLSEKFDGGAFPNRQGEAALLDVQRLSQHLDLMQPLLALEAERLGQMSEDMEFQLEHLNQSHEEQAHAFGEMEEHFRKMEDRIDEFDIKLKEELVKDGYVKNTYEVRSIQWDINGDITVNGEKIKESDKKKYNDLHKKYFEKEEHHHRGIE